MDIITSQCNIVPNLKTLLIYDHEQCCFLLNCAAHKWLN